MRFAPTSPFCRTVAQRMLHHDQCQHGLGDRRGADADARVVASLGDDLDRLVVHVNGVARTDDQSWSADRDAHLQVLPGADATQRAARVVGFEALRRDRIAVRGAALRDAGEAGADLDALHRIDAHHGVGDVGVHLVEQRLAEADRHVRSRHTDARTARVAGLAQRVHVGLELSHIGYGREEGIVRDMVPAFERDHDVADLRHAATELRAVLLPQPLLRHGASGDHRRGEAARRRSAAARVANAVFLPVREVGMAGAELLRDLAVVLAALVGVLDQQGDRRAGGLALVQQENLPASGSLRCVTCRLVPGRRRSRSPWISASLRAMPGGQPSMTHPIAGPWDSPKLVTAKRVPKVLPLMARDYPNKRGMPRLYRPLGIRAGN